MKNRLWNALSTKLSIKKVSQQESRISSPVPSLSTQTSRCLNFARSKTEKRKKVIVLQNKVPPLFPCREGSYQFYLFLSNSHYRVIYSFVVKKTNKVTYVGIITIRENRLCLTNEKPFSLFYF